MLVPISWLKEYVDLDLPLPQLADRITLAGLEVEAIENIGDWWDPETILVGRIVSIKPHPNADRLVLVEVDYGAGAPEQVTLRECANCGSPTTAEVCAYCRMTERARAKRTASAT